MELVPKTGFDPHQNHSIWDVFPPTKFTVFFVLTFFRLFAAQAWALGIVTFWESPRQTMRVKLRPDDVDYQRGRGGRNTTRTRTGQSECHFGQKYEEQRHEEALNVLCGETGHRGSSAKSAIRG